jgi:hypothetical protein
MALNVPTLNDIITFGTPVPTPAAGTVQSHQAGLYTIPGLGSFIYNMPAAPATPASAGPSGAAVAPNLQGSFNPLGSVIPYMQGHIRVLGKIVWGQALEIGVPGDIPANESFAVAFGYPLDPNEWQWIGVTAIWFNGVKVFGGDNDLPGLNWTFYPGKESQPVDPLILADKGAARTSAFRGMRLIVFNQAPLSASGGALPEVSAEFGPTKDAPSPTILVADFIKNIYSKGGLALTTESNFDDVVDGGVVMSDVAPVDFSRSLMQIYNYQIKDGLGAKLQRRAIGADLVIDATLHVSEMIGQPALTLGRTEPSQVPNKVAPQYADIDQGFNSNIQNARRPIFPIRQAWSDAKLDAQLPFATDATTILKLGFGTLYRGWTEQLALKFKHPNIRIEVGDVLLIKTDSALGDYLVLVRHSNVQRAEQVLNDLTTSVLLAQLSIATIQADSGDYLANTIVAALPFPDIITDNYTDNHHYMGHPLLSGGTLVVSVVVGGLGGGTFGTAFAPASMPKALPRSKFVATKMPPQLDMDTKISGPKLEDGSYYYLIDHARSCLQRVRKSDFTDTTYLDLSASTQTLPANGSQWAIANGFLYWGGKAPGSGHLEAYRLDLSLFSSAGLTTLSLTSSSATYNAVGAVVVGSNLLLTSFDRSANASRLYIVDLTDAAFATFTHTTLTDGPAAGQGYLGRGVVVGDTAYFLPLEAHVGSTKWDDDSGNKDPQIYGAKIDATGTSVTWFNITDDASVTSASKGDRAPWADTDNLYFLANGDHSGPPYSGFLAARKLSDLSVASGIDLATVADLTRFDFYHGCSDGSVHYLVGRNRLETLAQSGAVLALKEDFSAASLFYRGSTSAPSNDNFANAATISLNTIVTASNIQATAESGEPAHNGHAAQSSIWFSFTVPPGISSVAIDASLSDIDTNIGVYTGTTLAALSSVASGDGFSAPTTFTPTSGTRYYLALDGFGGQQGKLKFKLTSS